MPSENDHDRPFLIFGVPFENPPGLHNIKDDITGRNRAGVRTDLASKLVGLHLRTHD